VEALLGSTMAVATLALSPPSASLADVLGSFDASRARAAALAARR
jgi:hypothetical protein